MKGKGWKYKLYKRKKNLKAGKRIRLTGREKGWMNLIPISERTDEEKKEIFKKSSSERLKKNYRKMLLQECLSELLNKDVTSDRQKQILENLGFKEDWYQNSTMLMVALFKKGMTGDVSAIKQITEMMDKYDLNRESTVTTSQPVTIIIQPKETERIISKEDEEDIWKAKNGIIDKSEDELIEDWY